MQWISVKDRLPGDCESVLVYCAEMTITSAFLIFEVKGSPICWQVNDWDESDGSIRFDDVTHWMPLPEAPKDENEMKDIPYVALDGVGSIDEALLMLDAIIKKPGTNLLPESTKSVFDEKTPID